MSCQKCDAAGAFLAVLDMARREVTIEPSSHTALWLQIHLSELGRYAQGGYHYYICQLVLAMRILLLCYLVTSSHQNVGAQSVTMLAGEQGQR